MKKATRQRRIRRLRRLVRLRCLTGKPIVTHKAPSGRTGSVAAKKRGGLKEKGEGARNFPLAPVSPAHPTA